MEVGGGVAVMLTALGTRMGGRVGGCCWVGVSGRWGSVLYLILLGVARKRCMSAAQFQLIDWTSILCGK